MSFVDWLLGVYEWVINVRYRWRNWHERQMTVEELEAMFKELETPDHDDDDDDLYSAG